MPLHLNRKEIKGFNLKVGATLSLAGEDMSGQSSYTDTAETGDKPKQLSVRLEIPFKHASYLTDLVTLAEAKDEVGSRATYNVVNPTAAAMSIRQVKFQGDLNVTEDETLKLWRVSFKLTEKRSIPELKESRQQAQAVTDQTATGDTVAESDDAVPDEVELSSFEKALKWVDEQIGGTETA